MTDNKPAIKLGEQVFFILLHPRDDFNGILSTLNQSPFKLYVSFGDIMSIDGDDVLVGKPGVFGQTLYTVERDHLYATCDDAILAISRHVKQLGRASKVR